MKGRNYALLLLLFFCVATIQHTFGQSSVEQITKQHIEQNIAKHQLTIDDVKEWRITSDHVSSLSGVHHIYGTQQLNGIDVDLATFSLHLKENNEVFVYNNNFMPNLKNKLKDASSTPSINAIDALKNALSALHLDTTNSISIAEQKSNYELVLRIENENSEIPIKLMYYKTLGDKLVLAWSLRIKDYENGSSWRVKIDANSGQLLNKEDVIVSCGKVNHTHTEEITFGPLPKRESSSSNTTTYFTTPTQTYNVFPHPLENPVGNDRELVENPYDPIASPNGWHNINGVDDTLTKGNNIDAYSQNHQHLQPDEDSLIFNYQFTDTYTTIADRAAVTNAFYWANLCHDIFFHYGFDEAAGNFQEHNYSGNGNGGDSVIVETHNVNNETGTTCGSFFDTGGQDGFHPTIKIGTCGNTDGSFDNGIIVHEYAHGLVSRLVGGSNNNYPFTHSENIDEGWADWFGMMLTMSREGDNDPERLRPLGVWHEGNNNIALRTYDANNPSTYNYANLQSIIDNGGAEGTNIDEFRYQVGSVWGAILWDLTWSLIEDYGFDDNIYNGNGGNNIALKLVIEGMKLIDSNPGFQIGLDKLLAADEILFNGAHNCHIKSAFAGRGFGDGAFFNDDGQNITTNPSTDYDCPDQPCANVYITNADEFPTCNEIDFASEDALFEVKVNVHTPESYSNLDVTLNMYLIESGGNPVNTLSDGIVTYSGDGWTQLSFPIHTTDFFNFEDWNEKEFYFQANASLTADSVPCNNASEIIYGINIGNCNPYDCGLSSVSIDTETFPSCIDLNEPFPSTITSNFTLRGRTRINSLELVISRPDGTYEKTITIEDFTDDDFDDYTQLFTFPEGFAGSRNIPISQADFLDGLNGDYKIQVFLYTRIKYTICDPIYSQELTLSFDCDPDNLCENQVFLDGILPLCNEIPDDMSFDICFDYCTENTLTDLELTINNSTLVTGNSPFTSGTYCFNLTNQDFANGATGSYNFIATASYTNANGEPYSFDIDLGVLNFDDCQDVGSCSASATVTPNYSEGFETGFGLWSQSTQDNLDWIRRDGTDNIGPPSGFGDESDWYGHVQHIESGTSVTAILLSPCIDLRNSASATIDFDRFFKDGLNDGELILEISSDDGENWTGIHTSISDLVGFDWGPVNNVTIPEPFLDEIIRLRFVRTSSIGKIDTAIDNININHTVQQENCPDGNIQITTTTVDCQTIIDGQDIEVCGTICYEEDQDLSDLYLEIVDVDGSADTIIIDGETYTNNGTSFCFSLNSADFTNLEGDYNFVVKAVFSSENDGEIPDEGSILGVSFDDCNNDTPCENEVQINSVNGDCFALEEGGTIEVSGTICYEVGQNLSNLNLQIINDSNNVVGQLGVAQGNPTNGNTEFTYNVSLNDFDDTPQGNYTFRVTAFFTNGSVATGSDFDQTFGVSFDDCNSDPCEGIEITITNEDEIPDCIDPNDPWFDINVVASNLPESYLEAVSDLDGFLQPVSDIINNYTIDVIDSNNITLFTLDDDDIVPFSGFIGTGSVGISYRCNMNDITTSNYAFKVNATLTLDDVECPLSYTTSELSIEECEEPSCEDMAVSLTEGLPLCERIIGSPNGMPICVDYVIPQGYQPVTLTLSFNQINGSDTVTLPVSGNDITVPGVDQQGNGIGNYCFNITGGLFQTPIQGAYNVNATLVIEDSNGEQCNIELPEQPVLDFTDCEPEFSCDDISLTLASDIPKCDVILSSESFQLCLDYVLPFGYQDPVTLELVFNQQEGGEDLFSYTQVGLPISGTDNNGNSTGTFCFTVNTADFEHPFDGYYNIDAIIEVTRPDNSTCGTKMKTQKLSFKDCDGLCIPITDFWITDNKILNWNGHAPSYTLIISQDSNCDGLFDGDTFPQTINIPLNDNSFNLEEIIDQLGGCVIFKIKSDCDNTPWCSAQKRRGGAWSLPNDCIESQDTCPALRKYIYGDKFFWDDVAGPYDIEIIGDDSCSNGSVGVMTNEWIHTSEDFIYLNEVRERFGDCFKIRIYYSRDCPPTECLIQYGNSGFQTDGDCTSGVGRIITKTNNLKVYPNPASTSVTVQSERLEIMSIELYNFYGKPIKALHNIRTLNQQLDLSRLSSGYYMLKVVFEDGNVQYKNVIVK